MFARSTSINGDPAALDAGIAYVRDDVLPTITSMDGCVGLSMLVQRESGQCIVTSSWASAEERAAADLHLRPLRERGGEILRGAPVVDEWEVAVMHREADAGDGACCRCTWLRLDHGGVDRGIDLYRLVLLPEIGAMTGFVSASLLVDRDAGRACSTTTFRSRADMEASREQAWAIRDRGVREAGVDVLDVEEFDLVVAHLRVPELV